MRIMIGKQYVDVVDNRCAERDCLQIGMDHGPYVQGRGYTDSSYKSRLCCLRRHLHGCPSNSVCPACRTVSVEAPGAQCTWGRCTETTIGYNNKSEA